VTVVLEALFALANAEAILTIARRQGGAHKDATERMYHDSTLWPGAGSARDVVSIFQILSFARYLNALIIAHSDG
jgi:hypothetical protein